MSPAELAEIGAHPEQYNLRRSWSRLFAARQLWMIAGAYGCYGCASWFYFSWFPTWMVQTTGIPSSSLWLTSFPFLAGILANLAGGILADHLSLRFRSSTTLRLIPAACLGATTLVLTAMALAHTTAAVVVLSTIGFGLMDLMLPSAWAICVTIGGSLSGTATGVMNTAGQAGGFLATVLFGYIVKMTGSYSIPVLFIAGMVLFSAVLFSRIDSSQVLDAEGNCEPNAQVI